MPVNLGAEAQVALKKLEEAKTKEEQIQAIEELLAKMSKHKGTEKLERQLKKRLARLREEVEREKARRAKSAPSFNIKKEGGGQVVLVGLTNSGKSLLLNRLTGADAKVGDYPFTTTFPEVGILDFGGAMIQIVESPPLFDGCAESANGPRLFSLIRNADVVALVVDLSIAPLPQISTLLKELEKQKIYLNKQRPNIQIRKTGEGGIQLIGSSLFKGDTKELLAFLASRRIVNAVVHIKEPVTIEDIKLAMDESASFKPALIIASKGDVPGSARNFKVLRECYDSRFPIYPVSSLTCKGLDELSNALFSSLNIIRVYTKEPGGLMSDKPIVLKKGATVRDVIKRIRPSMLKNFNYAKVYGPSAKYDGEKVGLDHVLMDGDIIQIHVS
ncbi:MAG: 50S ribosome-binding GTPase [Candidatus Freyarchaeota archaeon]|nr:50S ribosome-binding GTPase [Candidatus Jordarchaeia archaeon]